MEYNLYLYTIRIVMSLKQNRREVRCRTKKVIHETPSMYYSKRTQEFIESEILKKQWIYHIINGERERDKIIFQCSDYIIIPDTEIVKTMSSSLNCLIIFTDKNLRSIRSLAGSHVPLLKSIVDRVSLMASDKKTPMMYFHYPPSVWQLHLHVTAVSDGLYTTNSMQKVVFIQDVLSNLNIDPEFYNKATISYILTNSNDPVTCQPDAC